MNIHVFLRLNCILSFLALARVQKLLDQAKTQADEITDAAASLDNTEDKFRDLLNQSRHAIDNAQAALDLDSKGIGRTDNIDVRTKDLGTPQTILNFQIRKTKITNTVFCLILAGI